MWDMKPDAPQGIRSIFQPIRTVVPGFDICDQMPLMAQHTDKIALIRSMTHPSNVHEPSVYHTLTGKQNPTLISPRNLRRRTDFPNFGAVLSHFTPPSGLPAAVTIPRPIGHDGVTYAGTHAGWLGPRHDPMELRAAPTSNDAPTHALNLPADVSTSRLIARRGLLDILERGDRHVQANGAAEFGNASLSGFHEQAYRMIASPSTSRAFNLELEPAQIRDRYGRNEYGESFLLARRMVEAGVRLVSADLAVHHAEWPGGQRLGHARGQPGLGNVGGFDCCVPITVCRRWIAPTPLCSRSAPARPAGRDAGGDGRRIRPHAAHQRHSGPRTLGAVLLRLLAGGGIRGGQVHGASDASGAYPRDNPVSPEDMLATIYDAMGIAPDALIHDREGRPIPICDGRPVSALFH